jgi:hypothetical protein
MWCANVVIFVVIFLVIFLVIVEVINVVIESKNRRKKFVPG